MPVSRVVTALHLGLGEFSKRYDVPWREREREREDRSSAGGRETARRGEVRARQRGKGTDGTARTQPIRTMAVWNQ